MFILFCSSAKVTLQGIFREGNPTLLQTQELSLGLFGRTGMEFKTTTMEEQAPLEVEIQWCHM